jgi:Glycosyl transferases group 1
VSQLAAGAEREILSAGSLRILHGPVEVAGVAGALVRGLRRRGHDAELVVMTPPPFGMACDRYVPGYRRRTLEGLMAPLRHEVLHFHFNITFCEFIDASWARVAGRPLMLMHYHGDDCRRREVTFARHPARARIYDASKRDERLTLRRTRLAGRLCDAAIVADLELLEHVRGFFRTVYVMPAPVEIPPPQTPLEPLPGDGPIVLHAPSNSVVKGTASIVAAIEQAAARCPLRRRLVSGVPQVQLLAEIARADIVIDQMNSETSGIFALQAMALGKPVVCEYSRDMLAPFAQGTPLVNANPETLAERLRELCLDERLRRELGAEGARFVRSVHDSNLVAGATELVYEHATRRVGGVFQATADGVRRLASSPA